jgi:hypothetical protein
VLGSRQHIALTGKGLFSLVHMPAQHVSKDGSESSIRFVIQKASSTSDADAPAFGVSNIRRELYLASGFSCDHPPTVTLIEARDSHSIPS